MADIRGNVPTRVQKLRDGNFDAILLAKAGVDRLELDLSGLKAVTLDSGVFIPATAQGVLAIQCRKEDEKIIDILSEINHAATQEVINVERSVLNRLHGGCQLPLGVFAEKKEREIVAHVAIAKSWDAPVRMFTMSHEDPAALIENILQRIHEE
mgnify:CR=1 FL=1